MGAGSSYLTQPGVQKGFLEEENDKGECERKSGKGRVRSSVDFLGPE